MGAQIAGLEPWPARGRKIECGVAGDSGSVRVVVDADDFASLRAECQRKGEKPVAASEVEYLSLRGERGGEVLVRSQFRAQP